MPGLLETFPRFMKHSSEFGITLGWFICLERDQAPRLPLPLTRTLLQPWFIPWFIMCGFFCVISNQNKIWVHKTMQRLTAWSTAIPSGWFIRLISPECSFPSPNASKSQIRGSIVSRLCLFWQRKAHYARSLRICLVWQQNHWSTVTACAYCSQTLLLNQNSFS